MKKIILLWLFLVPMVSVGQRVIGTATFDLPKGTVNEKRLTSYGDSSSKADKAYADAQFKRMKSYVDSLYRLQATPPVVKPPIVIPPGNTLPPISIAKCKQGPTIISIKDITATSSSIEWHGEDVKHIEYQILNQSGTGNAIYTDSIKPTGGILPIKYSVLGAGVYTLRLNGKSCSGTHSMQFTVASAGNPTRDNAASVSRHIYMNFTGYGFDVTDPTGLNADWRERAELFLNMDYKGTKFKGIDGIRVNMKWFEYEPSEGSFRDDKLIAAINWCKERGIKLSINLVPWRKDGDNFIPRDNQTTLAEDRDKSNNTNDVIWYERPGSGEFIHMPSMNSEIGRQKFKNCARHLSQIMKSYPQYVDYISCTTGQTEEFYLAKNENPIIISGYSKADLDAWRIYSNNQPVPYPGGDGEDAVNYMISQPNGKLWYQFQSESLRGFHAAFVQGVREGGGARSCGMYAGAGAPADSYNFMHKLNTVFSAGTPDQPDLIYSSEGTPNYNGSKLMATDLNMGTFPGAKTAIEFDPGDLSTQQIDNTPYLVDVSSDIFYEYGSSFFRRGGETILIAMAFHPTKIPQLTEACYKFKVNFLDSSKGMTPMQQGESFTYPVTDYAGMQPYRYYWFRNGGSLDKQVKFTLK